MKYAKIVAAISCAALTTAFVHGGSAVQGGPLRNIMLQRIRDRIAKQQKSGTPTETVRFGSLTVAVWRPGDLEKPHPLVIFSHGFHGINTQSRFLMQAMANDGYLVLAPNHKDAMTPRGDFTPPMVKFSKAQLWDDTTYADRRQDIVTLITALKNDPTWNSQIDWSNLILAGHSLGGYTVLALAGAWPSWKIADVKAVLALSPYTLPFAAKHTLQCMHVPVMYEGGTRDFGVTPFLKKKDGAFAQTPSPAYFVEFNKASHFAFSELNGNDSLKQLINKYSLAFLDHYVKGSSDFNPSQIVPGVSEAIAK